ncbi:hypothetical protein D3C86_1575320 [compost metagenome]
MSAASISVGALSLLMIGKYLSASSWRPQITTRSGSSWYQGAMNSSTMLKTRASRLVKSLPAPMVILFEPSTTSFITRAAFSTRIFCSHPTLTSWRSGLVAGLEVAARLVPFQPMRMRSSAWRLRMASRMRA